MEPVPFKQNIPYEPFGLVTVAGTSSTNPSSLREGKRRHGPGVLRARYYPQSYNDLFLKIPLALPGRCQPYGHCRV